MWVKYHINGTCISVAVFQNSAAITLGSRESLLCELVPWAMLGQGLLNVKPPPWSCLLFRFLSVAASRAQLKHLAWLILVAIIITSEALLPWSTI